MFNFVADVEGSANRNTLISIYESIHLYNVRVMRVFTTVPCCPTRTLIVILYEPILLPPPRGCGLSGVWLSVSVRQQLHLKATDLNLIKILPRTRNKPLNFGSHPRRGHKDPKTEKIALLFTTASAILLAAVVSSSLELFRPIADILHSIHNK